MRRWRKFNSDLPALLDEWASSLFRELDYRHEAANGTRFRELYGHLEVRVRRRAEGCLGATLPMVAGVLVVPPGHRPAAECWAAGMQNGCRANRR